MELGHQIKQHRTGRGFSQDDLAAKIYVSRQTVSSWENDKTYPDVESLLLLSVLFDVTVDALIKGDVEAMEEVISKDWKKIVYLGWGGVAVALLGFVVFFVGTRLWGWGIVPSAAVAFLMWGGGLAMLIAAGYTQKQHDLLTFKELVAFSKGEPIDRDNPCSQRARQHRVLKTVLAALVGAILGGIIGYCAWLFWAF